jgi:Flp pilus assembly protein TadG
VKRRERARGQGLVEFAVVLPVIVLVIFGILDLGRGVFTYNALSQAARQGSRTAMVDQDVADIRTAAIDYAPTLGLQNSNITVCFKDYDSNQTDCDSSADDCPQSNRFIGCLAIVEVDMAYSPMTPIIGSIVGSIAMSSTSIQPIEYVCPDGSAASCP